MSVSHGVTYNLVALRFPTLFEKNLKISYQECLEKSTVTFARYWDFI